MSFKNTLELVTKDIQEIEKIISKFQNYSSIPSIEIDLALHKLQNLYELLLMIREHGHTEKSLKKNEDQDITVSQSKQEDEDREKKEDFVLENEIQVESKEEFSNPPPTEPQPSGETELIETGTSEVKPTPGKEKEITIAEKLEKQGEFLNEKLAQGNKERFSNLQGGPIESISGSIGINDRFYFIREVFEGNSENFKKSLEFLDKAGNFNEAYNYLKGQLIVDMDSEATQSLLNLIRRKFISAGNE